jgi:hypothetical protein
MLLEVKTFYSTDFKRAAVIGQDKVSGKKAIYYYVANDNKTYDEVAKNFYAFQGYSELTQLGDDYVKGKTRIGR